MSNKTKILFLLSLFLAIILEGGVISIPLVFNMLLLWLIQTRDSGVFFLAFISGIFLDTVLVQRIGLSSSYFIVALFITALYEKKFETQTVAFVLISSFVGSFGYLLITHQSYVLQQAMVSAVLSALVFYTIRMHTNKNNPNAFE